MRNYQEDGVDIGALLDAQVAARITRARMRITHRRTGAAAKQARRDAGLVARHAAKLARVQPWGDGEKAT